MLKKKHESLGRSILFYEVIRFNDLKEEKQNQILSRGFDECSNPFDFDHVNADRADEIIAGAVEHATDKAWCEMEIDIKW